MIIKSISAENFGKFDRYSVNLDDNINVFYGDNEAGKTTLYEIISILLFAPQTDKEMVASNKLIKTDEKYARVYAIINIDGKEISIAREIYFNNTNLSIADQDNVSSLGNVNVPFIGELSKEMYESFHTIDYYNMATITNNVWDQIINVIEESHGAGRITPDYSSNEQEQGELKKSSFEDDIKAKEGEKDKLQKSLKDSQKKQKRMIRNQDKIDDLIGELEDVENNIELETSYLKEAEKMNQIRSTIKKTQDLTLEVEKYKNLKPWLPNLRKYYERLKLYSENVDNGIENPINMFDDLDEKPAEQTKNDDVIKRESEKKEKAQEEPKVEKKSEAEDKTESTPVVEEKTENATGTKAAAEDIKEAENAKEIVETKVKEEAEKVVEIKEIKEEKTEASAQVQQDEPKAKEKAEAVEIGIKEDYKYTPVTLPSEKDYNLAKEKINKFIEGSYLKKETPVQDQQGEKMTDVKEETEEKPEAVLEKKTDTEEIDIKKEQVKEQEKAVEEKIKTQFDFKQIKKVEIEPATKEDESIDIEPLEDIAPMDKFVPEPEIEKIQENKEQELPPDVKPLSIRKPKDMRKQKDENEDDDRDGYTNRYGQSNPYSDNVFPDMDRVSYSGKNLPKVKKDNEEENDKYSLSTSSEMPTQSQQVPEADMEEEQHEDPLLKAEEYLNNVDMKEIIAASKEKVEVDGETLDQIDKAQLRYKVIGQRVFEQQEMEMEKVTAQLKNLDTNAIYKTIVKFKGLSQKQRKVEHTVIKVEKQASKNNTTSIILGVVAFFSMMLGLACFFIDQIINVLPSSELTNIIYNVIKGLPLNNIIPGNILSGGAFVLIAVLLTIAIILGNDSEGETVGEQQVADEVQLEELKNKIRMAKREVVDALKGFPLPTSYLENPNNSIITVINELREAEKAHREIVHESKMPQNAEYRKMWELAKANLTEDEISEDLFDNISRLRRKIQSYKEDKQEKERKQKDAQLGINMISPSNRSDERNNETLGQNSNFGLGSSQVPERNEPQSGIPVGSFGITPSNEQPEHNTSESSSFALPTTQSRDVSTPEYSMETFSETPMPQSEEKNIGYPSSSDTYDTAPDNSYLGVDPNADISYPDSGGMFGATKDDSYSGANEGFGKLQDSGYPFNESDTPNDFSFPAKDEMQEETPTNDFGIPGIKRYSNDTPTQLQQENKTDDDPFGIPGINRYSNDAPAQPQLENKPEDDPFGIPGVKKYTNDYQSVNDEKPEDDPYGIQGVHKYTPDSDVQEESPSNDDPFGIPGVHRYTSYDNQTEEPNTDNSAFGSTEVNKYSNADAEDTETSAAGDFGIPGIKRYNSIEVPSQDNSIEDNIVKESEVKQSEEKDFGGFPSGLPGMDKFSNRVPINEEETNPFKRIKDALPGEPKHEPVVDAAADIVEEAVTDTAANAVDAAETVPFAGAVFSGGLPGLDKFSNRSEQEKPEEESAVEAQPEQEQTAEEDNPTKEAVKETVVQEETTAEQIEEDPVAQPAEELTKEAEEQTDEVQIETEEQADEVQTETEVQADEVQAEIEVQSDEVHTETVVLTEEVEAKEQAEPEVEEEKPIVKQKDRRQKEYDELLALLGSDPEATIREVEQLTRALHMQVTQRDEGMAELLKLNDAAVRLSTLSSNKWPYKQKATDASMERIDYLEADKLKIGRHLRMLEEKIENEEYEDTPQAIADRLKTLDDEIDQLKLENDKHALAEELIEKQKLLDMSSKDDRSHIIEDTSVYMKELTLGKYVEVTINDDQSGLSICDKDGKWFDTTKDRLSQATREQLYLALRISIADLFDEKSIIFPMFFDEALITWDKRRMKAVMRLLSKMSMHRQVIIFTCHDWLKDMISDYLIGAKIIIM